MKNKDDLIQKKEFNHKENSYISEFEQIDTSGAIDEILKALPSIVLLLNLNCQIVYCNKNYFEEVGKNSTHQILGLKPGELLGCIQVQKGMECGTSNSCRVCGLVNAVHDSQKDSTKILRNAKITALNNKGKNINIDLRITASPFDFNSITYTLVTINNISRESRIKSLERIFLHDLYDKVSSLKFLLETIVNKVSNSQSHEKLKHSKFLSSEIVEEIDAYRSVLDAEKGDLEINNEKLNSYDATWNAVNNISYHTVAHGKSIEVLEDTERVDFECDAKVLGRILVNMLKNALEETPSGGTVKVSCQKEGDNLTFWVHNRKEMSDEAKSNVFRHQFSTKGSFRGLGTYSMRLLGEEYLGGEVYFKSNKKQGTTFYFSLPAVARKT
jgi:signal transduction histidine kinase